MQNFLMDIREFFPILLEGVKYTLLVTLGSLVLSTLLGLVWALMRVSGIGWLSAVAGAIVNVIRGIPILVQLFYIYFVLPEFGIALSALQAGIIGLGIAYSAYQAENFRALVIRENPCRDNLRVIQHQQVIGAQILREIPEHPVLDHPALLVHDHHPRRRTVLRRAPTALARG